MNATTKKRFSRAMLIISLLFILVSMVCSSLVQSSGGTVQVSDIKLIGIGGRELNAKIYIPRDASPDHKLPVIIAQHGAQHNLEMQDMNIVELSRRGYIVISGDAYGHGSSSTREGLSREQAFSNAIAEVEYAYTLDIVDTDRIGIVGHSMGAAIASSTLKYYVQQEALGLGPNKIAACLEVGYDPDYVPYQFEGLETPVYADADWGVIAGKYDEYFFRQEDAGNDPARILESQAALSFVQQVDPSATGPVENGKIYKGEINGQEFIRAYYQNPEIHPQNVFSTKTSASTTAFFYESLGVPDGHAYIDPSNQAWVWKQIFNLLGLVGIFLFLFPFASWMMDAVPFFSSLKADAPRPMAPALNTAKRKLVYWGTLIINLAIPAVLAMPVMNNWVGKKSFTPATANKWFGDGAVNELAVWAIVVSVCLLGVFLLSYLIFGKKFGATTESWGYQSTLKKVWKSLLLAILTFGVVCVMLFSADFFFNTDFRIWLIALRVFTANKALYLIAYVPAFMFFFLVNSVLVDGGNRVEGMKDWVVTLVSCIANVGGIAVLIAIQYIVYSNSGTFVFNAMRTHNLFPLLVMVPAATIITRQYFKKTGNIYLGSFTVAMLFTIMSITQTAMTMSILPQ